MAKRIIPCLDIKDGRVVKGVKFVNLKDACDPFEAAIAYDKQNADELVFLNIDGSDEGRAFVADLLKRVKKEIHIPITVGGGIRSVEHIRELINAGADKVSINSAAVKRPELLSEAAEEFGSNRIVLAIDVTKSTRKNAAGNICYDVLTDGGTVNTGIDAVEWAARAVKLGVSSILPTSLDADGAKTGYDLEITRSIADATGVPVIASGGAGRKEDFLDVFTIGHADAALAASLFHFGEIKVDELKEYLHKNGVMDKVELKFDEKGLICAIAQDHKTGEVLMQAYMNKEAYDKTLKTGYAHYFSRSRNKLWKKGEESGNLQKVLKVFVDCDGDCVLLSVEQTGAACHTNNSSCFYREVN